MSFSYKTIKWRKYSEVRYYWDNKRNCFIAIYPHSFDNHIRPLPSANAEDVLYYG